MRRGNYLYRKGEYENAFKKYQEALVEEPDNPKIHYNIARALYKMEKYDEAIGEFQLGLLEKNKIFQANTFYNIGNCQFKKGQLNAAIESYKTSLLLNSKDTEAKENLEFCIKLKEQLQNQPPSDSLGQQQPREQPQPHPQTGEISREEAERILQALQNKEKEDLEKSRRKERKEHVDKDW
jgi:tetratricopeptide (TPR) repeat protein